MPHVMEVDSLTTYSSYYPTSESGVGYGLQDNQT